ncbi:MAG: hypothetical protein IKN02_06200 [Prevotella sp.]|nr:hypothetical protein [Prevotella sp.]
MKATVMAILMTLFALGSSAQTVTDSDSIFVISSDSVLLQEDTAPLDTAIQQELNRLSPQLAMPDSTLTLSKRQKRDWSTWTPNPKRAIWLALVIPGGGQIYNRKFWKLPIVYGGFLGCIYALTWNNMMYKDYSQAYLDIMDDDPTTASYNKFLHLGRTIDDSNISRYKEIFRNRKDKYRRWRDMSLFVMIGIYALSVIDAYVDAELSVFDISKDLSLKVQPTVIGNPMSENPIYASSLGVNCKLNF